MLIVLYTKYDTLGFIGLYCLPSQLTLEMVTFKINTSYASKTLI